MPMNEQGETIAAIASGAGAAGIGVIRVSGKTAAAVACSLLGRPPKPRHAHYCSFHDGDGERLDQGLLIYFPAPHSFTGEDVFELQAHGSPVMLGVLLRRLVELGARHARPGEFSERAYLNGKLDLAQAEAIADLIASGSEAAARAAVRSLDGEFSRQVDQLAEAVVRLRMWIEAAIDFPEEEIDFLAAPDLSEALSSLRASLDDLLLATRRGVRLVDGLHVVIIGRPNAGKSSLLNALSASDRAIVTEVPGTTRDVLREDIDLDGIALTLVDTAGLREATDVVEAEGIRRARAELEHADLVVLVSTDDDLTVDIALLDPVATTTDRLVIHNKIDLAGSSGHRQTIGGNTHIWLSAHSGEGIGLLIEELKSRAGHDHFGSGSFSARARHVAALERAGEHLHAALHALHEQHAGELAVEELRDMHRQLGEITGEFSSDDLLGRIFADFCIGK